MVPRPPLQRLVVPLLLLGALGAFRPPRDLDVGVPPGSPVDWGSSFPALTPPAEPLFPTSGDGAGEEADPRRSRSAPARPRSLDVRATSSFTLVRILTWDLAAHLDWMGGSRSGGVRRPGSGRLAARPQPPQYGEPLYWVSLAPLLRLLLHPGQVSRAATIAHLVEIGDPVLPVLAEAASETGLRKAVAAVRERVVVESEAEPVWAPEGPRQRMLARFVRDELLRLEPYDPEAAFGARLFLFAEEILPILDAYAHSEGATSLRRNAVAALARYRTEAALRVLLDVAATTADPVALMRALGALGRIHVPLDWKPLAARLDATRESVERVALIHALGRSASADVLPAVLRFTERAYSQRDGDELIAGLAALVRLPPGGDAESEAVQELLEDVERTARTSPRVFQPPGGRGGMEADIPDGPRARGELVYQLAVLALARRAPVDPERSAAVLALLEASPDLLSEGRNLSHLVGNVSPAARLFLLETLGLLRLPEGVRVLRSTAETAEAGIAAHALLQLPLTARSEVAQTLVRPPRGGVAWTSSDAERRLIGFEVLRGSVFAGTTALAKEILAECASMAPGEGDAATRFLQVSALRALVARDALRTRDLHPLLPHVLAPSSAFGGLPAELADEVDVLIELATRAVQKSELRKQADALVDFVLRHGMNPGLLATQPDEARKYLLGLVADVRKHKQDAPYLRLVRRSLLTYLLGYEPETVNPERAEFSPPVLLEEEILLSFGRTHEPQAAESLLRVLENPLNEHRAAACLALGMTGQASTASTLARFLLDADPFVRFCAYESLRHLVPRDVFHDWMYAPREERTAAAEEWWRWLIENGY